MITSRRRKTLLVSAVLISISGFSVFAEAPQMAGSGNNMSQSSMVDVKSGQATGEREISRNREGGCPCGGAVSTDSGCGRCIPVFVSRR